MHASFERKKIPINWVLAGGVIQANGSENCKSFSDVLLGKVSPSTRQNFYCKKTGPQKGKITAQGTQLQAYSPNL